MKEQLPHDIMPVELYRELYNMLQPSISFEHFKLICSFPFKHFNEGVRQPHLPTCYYKNIFKLKLNKKTINYELTKLDKALTLDRISQEDFDLKTKYFKNILENE